MVTYTNSKYNAEVAKKVTAPRTPSSSSSSSTSSASSSGGGSSSIGTGSIRVSSSGTYTQTVNGVTTKGVISGSAADLYARTGSSRRTNTTQATPQLVSTAVPIQQARQAPQQRQAEQVSRDFDFFRFQAPQQQDKYTPASFSDNRFANVPTRQLNKATPFTSKFETPKETIKQSYSRKQPTQVPSFVTPSKSTQEYSDFLNTSTADELKAQRPELFAITETPKPESKLQQYSREQSYKLNRQMREYQSNPTLSGASNIALTTGKAFTAGAVKGFTDTVVAPFVMATQPVKTLESASYILQNPSEFAAQIAKEVAINPAGAAGQIAGSAAGLKVQGVVAGKVSRAIKENAPKYVPDFLKPKQTVLPKGKISATPPAKVYEKLTPEQISSKSLSQAKKALIEAQKEMPNLKFKVRQTKDPISGANVYDVISEPVYARAPTISRVGGKSASQRAGRISRPEMQRASQGLPTKKQSIKNIRYAQEEYVQRQSPTETLRFNPQTRTLRDVKQYKQFTAEVKGQVSGVDAQTGKPTVYNPEIGINLRKTNLNVNVPKNLRDTSYSLSSQPPRPSTPKPPSQAKGEFGIDFFSNKQLRLQAKQLERMAPQDLLKQDISKFPQLQKYVQDYKRVDTPIKTIPKVKSPTGDLIYEYAPKTTRQLTGRERVIEQIKQRLREKALKRQSTIVETKPTQNYIVPRQSQYIIPAQVEKAVSIIPLKEKEILTIKPVEKIVPSRVIPSKNNLIQQNIKSNTFSFGTGKSLISFQQEKIKPIYSTVSGNVLKTGNDQGYLLNILQLNTQEKILNHKLNFKMDTAIDTSLAEALKTQLSVLIAQDQKQDQDQTTIVLPDFVTVTTPRVIGGGGGPRRPDPKPPQPKPLEPKPSDPKPPKPRDWSSKFKEEELPLPPIPEPDRKLSKQASFFAEVRTKGMFVKQSPIFGSMREALAFGKFKVGTSAAATFKVRETSLSPTSTYSKPFTLGGLYTKGTGSDKLYIERPAYRIKSSGELKEITYKGIATRKLKKTKFL